jgi:hypothetical protein
MNLLLDFWNNRLPTARSCPVDRRSEPACPRENVSAVFSGSELSEPKTDQLY